MDAFVIIHFGNKVKYLEYELYFLCNLRSYTKKDIVYLYSVNDTPDNFIECVKNLKLNIITKGYNDKNITFNIDKKFKSSYNHFNTLRTCNFMFAYLLTEYKKICILESDMIIMSDINKVFGLKFPSVFYTMNKNDIQKDNTNYLLEINKTKLLKNCYKGTPINGGVLLIEPNLKIFKILNKKIKEVIENNCIFPNETLFISSVSPVYNLPIIYNFSHYYYKRFNKYKNICVVHYNSTTYKPLDILKDNYLKNKKSKIKKKIILFYEKNIFDKYCDKINKILKF